MMLARNPDLHTDAERMMQLFPANMRSHAYLDYSEAKHRNTDGKLEVRYITERKPVTVQLWQQHLQGKRHLSLGLANEEGVSSVSCVDVDDYTVDELELAKQIEHQKQPFVITRSKSRGLHVFTFHDQPIPVEQAIAVAQGMARMLGLADTKVEYFPKPTSSDPSKLVKTLNMPYFGTEGCALKRSGAEMTLHEFLGLAEKHRTTAEQRAAIVATGEPVSKRTAPKDKGSKHAQKSLKQFCDELSQAPLGTRNDLLYRRSKDMGKMITPKWIDRDTVEREIWAAIAHWDDQSKCRDTMNNGIEDGLREPPPDVGGPITEDGTALEFAERHAKDLRFDHDAGKWYQWIGTHWKQDGTQFAFSEARDHVREAARDQPPRVINITSKLNFAGNVEKLARADRRLVATQESWDRDPFLIGTPGGTVDLRTGRLQDSPQR
jgi:hypothetical protein